VSRAFAYELQYVLKAPECIGYSRIYEESFHVYTSFTTVNRPIEKQVGVSVEMMFALSSGTFLPNS
jgi:hypothetical protein